MTDIRSLLQDRAALAGIQMNAELAAQLVRYYDLLARWNRTINLTSLSDPAAAIDRLLLEPVAAARYLRPGDKLIDLGSGGGSPAIPLALALRSPAVVMVESRSRKAAFLREAARDLSLPATVETARLEQLSGSYDGWANLVSVRAIRPDAPTLEVARRLVDWNGQIALFHSSERGTVQVPGLLVLGRYALLRNAWLSLYTVVPRGT